MTEERENIQVLEQSITDPHASQAAQNLYERLAGQRPPENVSVSVDSSN